MGILRLAVVTAMVSVVPAHAGPADWPSTNKEPDGQRFSPLAQINSGNVGRLREAWVYHMKPADGSGGTRLVTTETVPLVVGDTMFVSTPYGRVVALDSATGKEKWNVTLPDNERPAVRGVAYWAGGKGARPSVIVGTRQGRVLSFDAATGKLAADFGTSGFIDLKTADVMPTGMDKPYVLAATPFVYKDLIITGGGSPDQAAALGPLGDVRAWDVRTGKLVWQFHTVPRPGEVGNDTWGGESWKNRAGANVWGYFSADPARGILYMPVGAPNNDRMGIDRPGDNLFGSSIVAVNAATGKYIWHFQVTHHDIWDWDAAPAPMLFDVKKDGRVIPALGTVNKNSLLFILDRRTGKPIHGVEERPAPPSNVPGEITSPTQPWPVKPEPLAQTSLSRDNLYKDTPEHKAWCEALVDDNNMKLGATPYQPIMLDQYTVNLPGTQGGVNYYGGAFDPRLGLFVVNVNNLAQPMRMVKMPDGSYANSGPLAGTRRFWNPENHLPCGPTPWGQLVAVNVNTGEIAWRSTLGVTDILPEGKQATGRPGLGGAITTASGLTFVGATDDARFRAFETATGKEVWTYRLRGSASATPVTYQGGDGRQYVAVMATGGGQVGAALTTDELVVFSLAR
jgi:quinoprotein glucose dehydrogenase